MSSTVNQQFQMTLPWQQETIPRRLWYVNDMLSIWGVQAKWGCVPAACPLPPASAVGVRYISWQSWLLRSGHALFVRSSDTVNTVNTDPHNLYTSPVVLAASAFLGAKIMKTVLRVLWGVQQILQHSKHQVVKDSYDLLANLFQSLSTFAISPKSFWLGPPPQKKSLCSLHTFPLNGQQRIVFVLFLYL